uniref:NAC domain-containing protein n=1 Tax=Ananas comosus var. bracteatus TaxID=296719 RepID=A0A6V7Q6N4_ANACO|nr:unnamed protein product [Ananas comosus var. bracteatus]
MPIAVPIIAEVDLYKYDPWHLPGMAMYGEKEWYFFSPRDRKYPNGSRPNRAAGSGYWKATGADKPIGSPKPVGIKKALVFYTGKAPKGEKTNWIMHEYRLADVDRSARKKNSLRLDDWVLCRIYNKKGALDKPTGSDRKPSGSGSMIRPCLSPPNKNRCSEHVNSASPEFACEREVESQPRWKEWERVFEEPVQPGPVLPQFEPSGQASPGFRDPFLQDILMYWTKPF